MRGALAAMTDVLDELRLVEDNHGPASDREVGRGVPLLGIAGQSTGRRCVQVPRDAVDLALAAEGVVADEELCAEQGVSLGPTLHDLLLADVTAALAAADNPEAWRRAMVRVAATAVWCATAVPR